MIIDIYTHVFPKNLFDALVDKGIGNLAKRMQSVKSAALDAAKKRGLPDPRFCCLRLCFAYLFSP